MTRETQAPLEPLGPKANQARADLTWSMAPQGPQDPLGPWDLLAQQDLQDPRASQGWGCEERRALRDRRETKATEDTWDCLGHTG